jgi:hypothetical protein
MFKIKFNKQVKKNLEKMPISIQKKFFYLVNDLEAGGPIRPEWPNYSKLSEREYHCHLSIKWVACWRHEKNTVIIEVYYAGSRENAPY